MRRRTRRRSWNAANAMTSSSDRAAPAVGLAPAALKPNGYRCVAIRPNSQQPARSNPPLRPSLAAVAATLPTPLRGVAARQHNVALCKPPRCHGACETTSSPRAGAGTRRASASLRITHIHVGRRQALRAGHRGPTIVVLRRAHPCARFLRRASSRCAWTQPIASSSASPRACTRAATEGSAEPHAYTSACARRAHAKRVARSRPSAARLNAARSSRSRFVASTVVESCNC